MAGPTPSPTPSKSKYNDETYAQAVEQSKAAGAKASGTSSIPLGTGAVPLPGSNPITPTPVREPVAAPTTGGNAQATGMPSFGGQYATSTMPPPDAAATSVGDAQATAGGYSGPSITPPSFAPPSETSNDQSGSGGGGGSSRVASHVPVNGPYVLGADGRIHYIAPPAGFMSDFAGDPDAESGWIWNPNFQQYQRVQWNSKTGKWEAGTRFMQGPPVDAAGRLTPGLPLVGGLQGRYPGEAGFGQPNTAPYGANPGTALFPTNPQNVPFLPRSLAPAQGPNAGQNIAFSSLGMPMLSEGAPGAEAGQVGGQLVSPELTRPSQIEIRSPAGGFGIGVDTAQILAANGVKPTGNSSVDQALVTGILARRGELEQAGVPALVASEIVRQEVKSKSGQNDIINNVTDAAAFAKGGTVGVMAMPAFLAKGSPNPSNTMMVNEPMAMVGMQTGTMHGVMGEAGPERIDITPMRGFADGGTIEAIPQERENGSIAWPREDWRHPLVPRIPGVNAPISAFNAEGQPYSDWAKYYMETTAQGAADSMNSQLAEQRKRDQLQPFLDTARRLSGGLGEGWNRFGRGGGGQDLTGLIAAILMGMNGGTPASTEPKGRWVALENGTLVYTIDRPVVGPPTKGNEYASASVPVQAPANTYAPVFGKGGTVYAMPKLT